MKKNSSYPHTYASFYPAIVEKLTTLPRSGWIQWNIAEPETVWEHTIATRELAIIYKDKLGLSKTEFADLLNMIEIHDWPEAVVGDGVILGDEPNVHELRSDKKAREMTAMHDICAHSTYGDEILSLYKRYADGSDRVAKLVKELEKFQAVIQASEYERQYKKSGLTAEFIHYTRDIIHDSYLLTEFNKITPPLLVFSIFVPYITKLL